MQDRTVESGGKGAGDLTPVLLANDCWHDRWLDDAGIPVLDVPVVSVGGGLGSFATVQVLRISGLPAASIAVLGLHDRPYETYRTLARNSQIRDEDRLRSDSGSVMDNIWGWPSYAWREAAAASSWTGRLRPLATVLVEPFGVDYFTPRAADVYASVDRECDRIGWSSMLRPGRVRTVRPRAGGGFFVVHTPRVQETSRRVAYRCQHVHLSVGYPAVRMLDDLQRYRSEHGDLATVVNAYENHEHVYRELARRPAVVIVRGNGIVSSRIIQRLLDDTEAGRTDTRVVHLIRSRPDPGRRMRGGRAVRGAYANQAFNYPKGAWGGQIKEALERADPVERRELLEAIGGTTTPPRRAWRKQIERAEAAGRYSLLVGDVLAVDRSASSGVRTVVNTSGGHRMEIEARFVIDATGLVADVGHHQVLADLLQHCGAHMNELGRLAVAESFEVTGTRSGAGRLYASGSITLGGAYAPVDSFLGLQFAALQIGNDLNGLGVGSRVTPGVSLRQWWRWLKDAPP